MELETNRLILRPFKPSDITPTYLEALNDHSIIGLTEARHQVWDRDRATAFIEGANSATSKLYGVFIKPIVKPIGNVRLFNIHPIHRRAELSFLFYDKGEWGKGYATEAVTAVVSYAFDMLKLHRIVADYYAENIASSRVFEKIGFSYEGVFKDHFLTNDNNFVDSIRVARINTEY